MANRAYLYSDDRPDAWDQPDQGYYDSRGSIPLAWFYFFKPEDVRLINVLQWQEVRFSAVKDSAVALFERRKPLLLSIVSDKLSGDAVARFINAVKGRPGHYLLMNPDDVIGGMGFGYGDDEEHANRFADILAILGDGEVPTETARAATRCYVGDFASDPSRRECQILGFTYS